jgi:anti-sigma factor (TIGR02949 family)
MDNCNDTLRELQLFLANELTPHTRSLITDHLDGCHDCLQAYDFHAELRGIIARKAREYTLPEGLMKRIEQCFTLDQPTIFPTTSAFGQPSPFPN